MKSFKISIVLALLFCLTFTLSAPTTAQEESCPVIVQTAVNATDEACQGIGRNQVCYGNTQIEAVPYEDVDDLIFAETGDTVSVADVQSLQLAPMDEATGAWGVALMRIQANLPDTMPGQNVTFVLFGDVELENLGNREQIDAPVTLQISASGVNLRTGPSTDTSIYSTFSGPATANGRNEDGSWLRLLAPGGTEFVWVAAFVVTVEGDVMTLPVVALDEAPVILQVATDGEVNWYDIPMMTDMARGTMDGTFPVNGRNQAGDWLQVVFGDGETGWVQAAEVNPEEGDTSTLAVVEAAGLGDYGPMQAFYFRTGVGDTACEEAPNSGILIQTPEGAGEVAVNVNGVEFSLASTAYIAWAELPESPGAVVFVVHMIEGTASYYGGMIYAGEAQAFAQHDHKSGPVGEKYNYGRDDLKGVPNVVVLLPRPVQIPQRGVLPTGGYDLVVNNSMPDNPNGCMVVVLHKARADMTVWNPYIGLLTHLGYHVFVVDMPGHGQTGGPDDWGAWLPAANALVSHLLAGYGYDCVLFIGSSVGANVALNACVQWQESCLGAVGLSTGYNYGGYGARGAVEQLVASGIPVFLVTLENDAAGASGDVLRAIIEGIPSGVTVYTLPAVSDPDLLPYLHGAGLLDENEAREHFSGWLAGVTPPRE